MCGISGIIQKDNSIVAEQAIRVMNDAIAHRGPDAEGIFTNGNIGLGHRRLSILDLSELGSQPMHWNDKYTIVYNGEVYNYLEIREELLAVGYTFQSETDTEVMLAAYDHWGVDCTSRFNGMWSFALYDKEKNSLFCSRDRFGVKPFYYRETATGFFFGSEIKQLLIGQENPVANLPVLLDYLIVGLEDCTTDTFFKEVVKLPAGHNLIYDLHQHSYTIQPFYTIHFSAEAKQWTEEETIANYSKTLSDSVKLRLRSDVKVGTCLSGGLDSSAIASIAAGLYTGTGKFQAIHAKSEDRKTDESSFAEQVATHLDLELSVIEPTYQDFASNIDTIIETQEEPFGSPSVVMQYFVLEKARAINCLVMLDGQGGDETLLGYERYYPALVRTLPVVKKWNALRDSYKNSKMSIKQTVAYIYYFGNYKLRMRTLKKRAGFIQKRYLESFHSPSLAKLSSAYSDINTLQVQEIKSTQLPHLLRYEDKNSMRHSVEARLPFIDYRAVETALSAKIEYKITNGWTKYLLRKSIEPKLPHSIVWRKNKFGFNAPEDSWLSQHFSIMETAIKSSHILSAIIDWKRFELKNLNPRMQWRLYNLAKWEQLFHVVLEK